MLYLQIFFFSPEFMYSAILVLLHDGCENAGKHKITRMQEFHNKLRHTQLK